MATAVTITYGEGVLMFESAVFNFGSDGINDPMISALARAYRGVMKREFDVTGQRWILNARKRILRGETTMDMEVRRLQNRKRLSVW